MRDRRRALAAIAAIVVVAVAVYWFLVRERQVAPRVSAPRPAATLGSGPDAIVVTANGALVRWFPVPAEPSLPALPEVEPPKGGKLGGPILDQARVLGAAPPPLRPYLERSYYGESGVDVVLTSGIELRFGDATQAARKWRAAAAVLADPAVTALDYVDLHAPSRPALYGEGHLLPAPP